MKLCFGLASLALLFASAQAGEIGVALNTHDSERLYSALHVIAIETGEETQAKRLAVTQAGSGFEMLFECTAKPRWNECFVILKAPVDLEPGQTVALPESMSQHLVSEIDLERRPDLGKDWTGFEARDGRFSLFCEQVYTPTDLPIYTGCTVRIGKKPTRD